MRRTPPSCSANAATIAVTPIRWSSSPTRNGNPLKPPHKLLSLDVLTDWLAAFAGLEYVHIDPLRIDFSTVTDVVSNAYATRFRILPIQVTTKEVVIATAEPFIREWESELKPILRKDIRRVISNPDDISRYLVEFYNLARSVKKAVQAGNIGAAGVSSFEQLVELGKSNRQFDANDQHIVHIVDWLWQYAFEQRASDIHIEPRRELGIVRFRIDGVLHQVYQIPSAVLSAMMSRIKILGRMDVVEKRRPQDGRIKTRTSDGQEVELRLSTLPTAFGEKMVMRIFDPEVLVRDFAELGFTEEDVTRWNQMTRQPNGIVLVTGPTGSGKTTTLYSTLKQLATPEVNVCTIEDPIEMIEPSFNQVQVQHSIDMGFAQGIRAFMRQDPDIIMVGEIRDLETAEMAIQAALTGHLVLTTLHTNDTPTAVTRLQDLGVPAYLLNATLLGVMAQRLVRTLCPHCKAVANAQRGEDEKLWGELVAPWKASPPDQTVSGGRLPGVPDDGLSRPHGSVRDSAHVAGDEAAHHARHRSGQAARAGLPRRHETAACQRCHEGCRRRHDTGGSGQGRAAGAGQLTRRMRVATCATMREQNQPRRHISRAPARHATQGTHMAVELYNDGKHICLGFYDLVDDGGGDAAVQCNQFLVVDNGKAALIDPGGGLSYNSLLLALQKHVAVKDLEFILASHADPDVIASVNKWFVSTQCKVYVSRLWTRFLPHFTTGRIDADRIVAIADEGAVIPLGCGFDQRRAGPLPALRGQLPVLRSRLEDPVFGRPRRLHRAAGTRRRSGAGFRRPSALHGRLSPPLHGFEQGVPAVGEHGEGAGHQHDRAPARQPLRRPRHGQAFHRLGGEPELRRGPDDPGKLPLP